MIDKKDAQWWILEAQKHPDSAQDLIRMLADRLAFIDKQNEELRGEIIALRRKLRSELSGTDVNALQQRIQELENVLREGGSDQRLLIYTQDQIEANISLSAIQKESIGEFFSEKASMLICSSTARLVIVTSEARVFNISANDLPIPKDGRPASLGNPRNIAVILDQSLFEQYRFLTLLSQNGYLYVQLLGTVSQLARKGDKLLRNLIPDDPIISAILSSNAELFAISQKGRWIRFPEKSVAGVGSQAMELPKGDKLAGITSLMGDPDLTFITSDGLLFVRPSAGLAARRAPGTSSGMLFKNQTIFGVTSSSRFTVLTRAGKVIPIKVKDLPFRAQSETGVNLPGLVESDSVLTFINQ